MILTEQLEKLINNRNFSELNSDERKYALSQISEEEYCSYYVFFQQVKKTTQLQEIRLNLREDILPELQQAFKKKHAPFYLKTIGVPYFKLKLPVYQPIAASFILSIILVSLLSLNQQSNDQIEYSLSDEEFNNYTQFDYTAYYVTTDEFAIEDEVTDELMNMELPY